ncbi:transporter, dicarboxylate/amino acid:cation Na+/H+ symporter family protein [Gleimia coleocanis DSM 15436]|uniref:Transporter, dicarboxylate/amino acid:cation Na+/H+ symporter family protein n=1 Tax=Gleimia coleocanis DSM 15436 TaxID=525245 RepID=C0W069_9ACTO|nr:dicarboxylate/amino acid:cation symporter [Gleimia coleocanis]EEH63928.1 transporter, dicarboxylate/amino acid:cation Na+/H+ symporter family protein [Gleimia coleocanis DSM 15436]
MTQPTNLEQVTQAKHRWLKMPSFTVQIFLGLAIGMCLGYLATIFGTAEEPLPWLVAILNWVGSSFVSLLFALVPPLIFVAMVVSINNLRGVANATSLALKTLLWFAITALLSVSVGIGLGLLFEPGLNTSVSASEVAAPSRVGGWTDFINGIIPNNFLGLEVRSKLVEGEVTSSLKFNALQILLIGIAVGIATLKAKDTAKPFLEFAEATLKVLQKILWGVIRLAPVGTAGLIGTAVATYGWSKITSLGWFVLAIYVGLFIVGGLIYPVLLRLNGVSALQFYKGAWPAIQLAFVSRSSLGTLPVTQHVATENLGVPASYGSFATSLGATTKMDGCAAIYPAVAAIFVAQFFGLELGVVDYLLIIFVAVVGSAATAGLTGATVMLTLTLSTLGLPLEGVGLLLAVDPILDMGRTALNVTGQMVVPVIVSAREKILDRTKL